MRYNEMPPEALRREYEDTRARYAAYQAMGLSLNLSRGRPHADQLELSNKMLSCFDGGYASENGIDCRNYGGLDGLPEMKRLFGKMLDVRPDEIIVGGNSSLNLMFDCIAALIAQDAGWRPEGRLKFICPAPGYDRHFFICEYFGIEMLPVDMTPDGPDMGRVEELASDPAVVGMWCVPVFSNPQGYTYSDETVRRLAAMPAANPGFRLLWDNAYTVHHFRGSRPRLPNILRMCEEYQHSERPYMFTSFSKISFAGGAVSCAAAGERSRKLLLKRLAVQTVGPDKLNQLRHVRFFRDLNGVLSHMEKIAAILRPKFELADSVLRESLAWTGAGSWRCPDGGYFISFDTVDGCAKRVVRLCGDAGVAVTDAGATFPYGNDPRDRNIRLCPSSAAAEELEMALRVFSETVKLAALEHMIKE